MILFIVLPDPWW